jgi:bifunctional ADP-heptose synthase (sugar kinase/adenylyltransferase)
VGADLRASYGGRVIRADMQEGFSTTNTIKKMAS